MPVTMLPVLTHELLTDRDVVIPCSMPPTLPSVVQFGLKVPCNTHESLAKYDVLNPRSFSVAEASPIGISAPVSLLSTDAVEFVPRDLFNVCNARANVVLPVAGGGECVSGAPAGLELARASESGGYTIDTVKPFS